jgi:hypothetical protein
MQGLQALVLGQKLQSLSKLEQIAAHGNEGEAPPTCTALLSMTT